MPQTLLLADDSVTIRRVIELTFADENIRVVSVSSGRDAISSIESAPPDVILADAGMPDVSGYDIAAFVKSRPQLRHIPVILLAGAFEPLDEARSRKSGSDGVLVKPFEPQMVVARVRELLSQPAAAAPAAVATQSARAPQPVPVAQGVTDSFDASLDRLDAAFANTDPQGPALDATSATDFANDLRQLRSGKTDSGGFDRQEFGDWDLPARPGDISASHLDALEPEKVADVFTAPQPEPVVPPLPAPIAFAPRPAPPVTPPSTPHVAPMPAPAPAPMPAPAPAPAPAPYQPLAAVPADAASTRPAPSAAPAPGAPSPTPLAEAFSSLLAAEEGRPHAPLTGAITAASSSALTEAQMDLIVDRVLARLGSGVRGAVIDLAERLVKAEIDRLKALR